MNPPAETLSPEEPENTGRHSETVPTVTTANLACSAGGEQAPDLILDDTVVDVEAAEVCVEPPVVREGSEHVVPDTREARHEQVAAMATEVIEHQEKFSGSYARTDDERPTSETKKEFITTLQKVASERPIDDNERGDMAHLPGDPHDTVEENRYTNLEEEGELHQLHAEVSNEAPATTRAKDEGPPEPVSGKASFYARGPKGLRDVEYECTKDEDETVHVKKVETKDGEWVGSGEPPDEEVRAATTLVKKVFALDAAIADEKEVSSPDAPPDPETGVNAARTS